MSYEEVKKQVERYPDAFPTNKIVIEELEKISLTASKMKKDHTHWNEEILQSLEIIKKALFGEAEITTFEEMKKKYPDIEKNCPKSPNGLHAIFSEENMSGCCIYCGKAIA